MAMTERAATPPPTNLPQPVSELIGRDEELAEVLNLVAAHRLVTLTGAGGIGKTRLALAPATRAAAAFCPMGSGSPNWHRCLIPTLSRSPSQPRSGSNSRRGRHRPMAVANALRSKQLLLVLDNCEHVVDAAASDGRGIVARQPGGTRDRHQPRAAPGRGRVALPGTAARCSHRSWPGRRGPASLRRRSAVRRAGTRGRATFLA